MVKQIKFTEDEWREFSDALNTLTSEAHCAVSWLEETARGMVDVSATMAAGYRERMRRIASAKDYVTEIVAKKELGK